MKVKYEAIAWRFTLYFVKLAVGQVVSAYRCSWSMARPAANCSELQAQHARGSLLCPSSGVPPWHGGYRVSGCTFLRHATALAVLELNLKSPSPPFRLPFISASRYEQGTFERIERDEPVSDPLHESASRHNGPPSSARLETRLSDAYSLVASNRLNACAQDARSWRPISP